MFVKKNNMDMKLFCKKRGLSGVITTVILIAIVMVVVSIVWVTVNNILKDKMEEGESCFGIFEKVILGSEYTCYDSDSEELQFSIEIKDIDVDKVLVSIHGKEESKSFEITKEGDSFDFLRKYSGVGDVKLPKKNAGLTYVFDVGLEEIGKPFFMEIAPVVNGKQCEVSDSLSEIDSCLSFVW